MIELDWDEDNITHLKRHRVTPDEFEQVLRAESWEMETQVETGEERYKALGMTLQGRILVVIWTPRNGRVRAVTAYPADKRLRKWFLTYGVRHEEDEGSSF